MSYSYIWTKTLLSSLRFVKSVCGQIDNALMRRVMVVSGINSSYDGEFDNTYAQFEKVILLMEKKKRTIRLNVTCREIMSRMLVTYRKSLILKYQTSKTDGEIEKLLCCSIRTFFRYTREGLKEFTKIREELGYSDEFLEELYKDDKWVMRLKLKAEDDEEVKQKLIKITKKSTKAA